VDQDVCFPRYLHALVTGVAVVERSAMAVEYVDPPELA
jgi:hypothetical protein